MPSYGPWVTGAPITLEVNQVPQWATALALSPPPPRTFPETVEAPLGSEAASGEQVDPPDTGPVLRWEATTDQLYIDTYGTPTGYRADYAALAFDLAGLHSYTEFDAPPAPAGATVEYSLDGPNGFWDVRDHVVAASGTLLFTDQTPVDFAAQPTVGLRLFQTTLTDRGGDPASYLKTGAAWRASDLAAKPVLATADLPYFTGGTSSATVTVDWSITGDVGVRGNPDEFGGHAYLRIDAAIDEHVTATAPPLPALGSSTGRRIFFEPVYPLLVTVEPPPYRYVYDRPPNLRHRQRDDSSRVQGGNGPTSVWRSPRRGGRNAYL